MTSKKPMDQLVNPPLPKSWTPNHKNGFQEIAAPGGATENYAPVTDPITPAAAAANQYEYEPINPAAAATDNPSNSDRPRRKVGTYKNDPCLFMNETIVAIVYVDDILIYGKSEAEIDKLIECLKSNDIALHKEGTAEGYLGVDIQKERRKNHSHTGRIDKAYH